MNEDIKKVLQELIENQEKTLLSIATAMIPTITTEDILQPNDYRELDMHPEFRYEEGVLAGMLAVQSALFALMESSISPNNPKKGI